jgi:3-oxoadipate enol-lactonase
MEFASINGVAIAHSVRGPAAAPAIIFVNSLGTDSRIWDAVAEQLDRRYRVVRYDKRGHGLSDTPAGPYRIDDHVADLVGLAGHLGIEEFGLAGVSVGGLIAMAVAARNGALVRALVLCDTAVTIGTTPFWNERIALVMDKGTAAIADQVMERWFSPGFRRDRATDLRGWRNMFVRTDREGYAATCATLRDADLTTEAAAIKAPTLVVVGEHDKSTPPELVQNTAELIGARFEIIPGAGHIPSIEQPEILAALIDTFTRDAGHA